MDPDDLEPRKQPAAVRALDPMSVVELEAYIAELESEIDRVRAAIRAKRAQRVDAESIFRR
jgi:uncharacterized small protein (DUF1192 family)